MYNLFCNLNKLGKRVKFKGEMPSSKTFVQKALRVALPSIAESFLFAIVGLVDTYMVSGLGDHAISAVGLTTQPRFLFLSVFFAINLSISTLVARRRGEGKQKEANEILQQSVIIVLALTVIVTIISFLVANPIIQLMGSTEESHVEAVRYFKILMLGCIFSTITMLINAAQRGVGNTKISMQTNLVSNLVNVAFNYLLIGGNLGFPKLGVAGAATATVIGMACASVMALISVSRKNSYLQLFKGFKLKLDKKVTGIIVRLGTPSMIEQFILRFGFIVYFMLVARLGTNAFAAHNIGMSFLNISFAFGDGLSVAVVALVGRSLGEKRQDLALIYGSVCQKLGLVGSFMVAVIYAPFGYLLFSLFSKTEQVLDYGAIIMPLISVITFIQITMLVFISCLRAAGDMKYVAFISLVCIGIMRPLLSWILCYPLGLGLVGAWLGMMIDQSMRLFLSYRRYKKGEWMNISI